MALSYGKTSSDGWVKIFNHNVAGGYWSSDNGWAEVLNSNPTDPDNNKYSQLYKLSDNMKIGDEFILKLVMDNHTNIWAQTHNPLENAPTAATVPGYRAISVSTTANSWGGISRSDGPAAFLDGYPANTSWYYPIGSIANWNGGLPQYDGTGHPFCELWVKIR